MTQTSQSQKHLPAPERFISPDTPPTQRIDELIPSSPKWEQQTNWLKATLAKHWPGPLPQPFIGFDDEEDAFVSRACGAKCCCGSRERPGHDCQGLDGKTECSPTGEIQRCAAANPTAEGEGLARDHGQEAGLR